MRDICEKYQFILCQLFFNIDAVAQPIEIKNDTQNMIAENNDDYKSAAREQFEISMSNLKEEMKEKFNSLMAKGEDVNEKK